MAIDPIRPNPLFAFLELDQFPLLYLNVREIFRLLEVCRTSCRLLTERRVNYVRAWAEDWTIPEEEARKASTFIQAYLYVLFPFPYGRPSFEAFSRESSTQLDPLLSEVSKLPKLAFLKTAIRLIETGEATCKKERAFLRDVQLLEVLGVDPYFYKILWTHPTSAILHAFRFNSLHSLQMMAPLIVAMQRKRAQSTNTHFALEKFVDLDPLAPLQKILPETPDMRFIGITLQIARALNMPQERYAMNLAIYTCDFTKVQYALNCYLTAGYRPAPTLLQYAELHECPDPILNLIRSCLPPPTGHKRKSPPEQI